MKQIKSLIKNNDELNVNRAKHSPTQTPIIELQIPCPKCGKQLPLYAKFGAIPQKLEQKIQKKSTKFPSDNKLNCDCGFQINLIGLRNQLEKQIEKK
ncbi:MAG: hypothetical protein KJN62_03800 [Deltaproteobacteria bacterium]|nr:hypothetical protein [Deltaproteobacteria bacterium]